VIRDRAAYERTRVASHARRLRSLTLREGIRIAEALLSSSLLVDAAPGPRPRPTSLARALGIDPARLAGLRAR